MGSPKSFTDLAHAIMALIANPELHQFQVLAREVFEFQFKSNEPYRTFCKNRGITPNEVQSWQDVPFIGNSAFKQCELTCLSEEERSRVFVSSGTTDKERSRHYHNDLSLEVYNRSLLAWFQESFLDRNFPNVERDGIEIVSLTPWSANAPHSSLVHMLTVLQPDSSKFFGRTNEEGQWLLDVDLLRSFLCSRRSSELPIVLVGTAFNFVHLLDQTFNRPLPLPRNSVILETGGYKGRSRTLERPDLHNQLAELFLVPQARIRTEYGMCELGSQGYDQPDNLGVFNFPPWTRVQILSPENGQPVAEGIPGLIQIFDLTNIASVCAIQTSDLGIIQKGGLELLGRDPSTSPRGCSLFAT